MSRARKYRYDIPSHTIPLSAWIECINFKLRSHLDERVKEGQFLFPLVKFDKLGVVLGAEP